MHSILLVSSTYDSKSHTRLRCWWLNHVNTWYDLQQQYTTRVLYQWFPFPLLQRSICSLTISRNENGANPYYSRIHPLSFFLFSFLIISLMSSESSLTRLVVKPITRWRTSPFWNKSTPKAEESSCQVFQLSTVTDTGDYLPPSPTLEKEVASKRSLRDWWWTNDDQMHDSFRLPHQPAWMYTLGLYPVSLLLLFNKQQHRTVYLL